MPESTLSNLSSSSPFGFAILQEPSLSVLNIERKEEVLEKQNSQNGQGRPKEFNMAYQEIACIFAIAMSQTLTEYFVSGFSIIIPELIHNHIITQTLSIWPSSMFSLAIASTTIIFGRLADIYGGQCIYIFGMAWFGIWGIVIGFARNEIILNICRAFLGIGASAILPSGLMIMGSLYRPGRRKNIAFSIYGACGPIGFFFGILVAALTGQLLTWRYYFWIGATLAIISAIIACFTIPGAMQQLKNVGSSTHRKVNIDWRGGAALFFGMNFFLFAIIASSHAPNGWKTPYVLVSFGFGATLIITTIWVEGWLAINPLIPSKFITEKCMPALLFSLFLYYGCFSVFLFHASEYMEQTFHKSALQIAAWYTPLAAGGFLIPILASYILHIISGTVLLAVAGLAWIMAPLLFAVAPINANYWNFIFPSMLCATIGIEITYNVCNIFITGTSPRQQQGLAGAIPGFLFHVGGTVCLAIADIIKSQSQASGERRSCQAVFWFHVGCASVATLILASFVRIEQAKNVFENNKKPDN